MHSEIMEIRRIEGRLFHRRLKKYRPKAEKVVYALVKRFCSRCLRVYHIGRGFKLTRTACKKYPVLEAISSIEPRLEWIRREVEVLRGLKRKYGGLMVNV